MPLYPLANRPVLPGALLPVQHSGPSPGTAWTSHMPVTQRCSLALGAPGPHSCVHWHPFQLAGPRAIPVAQYLNYHPSFWAENYSVVC